MESLDSSVHMFHVKTLSNGTTNDDDNDELQRRISDDGSASPASAAW